MKKYLYVYDDLWENGYRFDDILNNTYVEISRENASNEYEALDFLGKNHKKVHKKKGTSRIMSGTIYSNALFLFI
jgi:hypothetical protein